MRQEQQHGEEPARRRGQGPHGRPLDGPPPRGGPFPQRDEEILPLGVPQQHEPHHGDEGQGERLHHGERQVAVHLGAVDLGSHEAEAAAENVGRAEGAERGHEREQRRAGERGPQQGQDDAPEDAAPPGAERLRRLEHRLVEPGEAGPRQQVEVDVHRVRVDQQDRTRALEAPRRPGEAERVLQRPGDEAGLSVQEQERDDADERRQHRRERDQGAQRLAARELEPLEQERQRHADQRRERYAGQRDPEARPQRRPFARPRHERPQRVGMRGVTRHDEDGIHHQPGEQQRQGETKHLSAPAVHPSARGSLKVMARTAST